MIPRTVDENIFLFLMSATSRSNGTATACSRDLFFAIFFNSLRLEVTECVASSQRLEVTEAVSIKAIKMWINSSNL